jgi:predicted GTPase
MQKQFVGDSAHVSSLDVSIAQAVVEGKLAAAEIEAKILKVRTAVLQSVQTLAKFDVADPGPEAGDHASIAMTCCNILAQAQKEIHETFLRRSMALDRFNLVLFGRTGAGKSTLIEALTSGDGISVSQGESDWTVDVRPVIWHECQLVDTPGINGWGRTERRADLEEKARLAVEAADIVLLCFDTQSQQEAEFAKVAEWANAYGKPIIAIINNRNPVWRNPHRESHRDKRANLSRTMLQHVSNVREGLANQGFGEVPVVCLSSKRALFGRARMPFSGPDGNSLVSQREKYGQEVLLRWSNIFALESLIIEALTQDAPVIRIGMLVASLRGDLTRIVENCSLQTTEARARAELLDLSLGRTLRLLGYPAEKSAARPVFRDQGVQMDYLAWLEDLRGGRFAAPSEGEFQEYLERILTAALGRARAESLEKAEDFVIKAFNEKTPLDENAFVKAVYDSTAIELAQQRVVASATKFLTTSLDLLAGDLQFDLAALQIFASRVDGKSGVVWRRGAIGARLTTVGLGIGGTALLVPSIAATLITGGIAAPVILAAGLAIAFTSMLSSWFGNHAARKAEATRGNERRVALANARRSVNATFDGFTKAVADAASEAGSAALAKLLQPLVREAVACHLVMQQADRVKQEIKGVQLALPKLQPEKYLLDAAGRIESRRYPGNSAAGRLIWAGEDWVDDPTGLNVPSVHAPLSAAREHQIRREVVTLWELPTDPRPAAKGKDFITLAEGRLGEIALAAPVLGELRVLATLDRPAIYLVGDYNAGKTSFIKRLLAETGIRVPDWLRVRADPTTSAVVRYDCKGAWLVDTPGLQSLRKEDTALTVSAVADASVVVWLLHGNVLDTSLKHLVAVLHGDTRTGIAGKAGRMLLVLGRSDELGRDPYDDPEEYRRTVRRKIVEIVQALRSQGVEFPEARVLAVAADPYGRVGDSYDVTARDYDVDRSWDGITEFLAALSSTLIDNATLPVVDAAVIEGALARLARVDRELAAAQTDLQAQADQTLGMMKVFDSGLLEGEDLMARFEADLDRLLDETTESLLGDVMGARDPDELHLAAQRLARWWEDPVFSEERAVWEKGSQSEIDRWSSRISDLCTRRVASREFRSAFPTSGNAFAADALRDDRQSRQRWWAVLSEGVAKAGSRDVVYGVGKFLGVKFKPWGAVKIAGRFAKAAPFLAILGTGLDAWTWWSSHQKNKEREKARNEIASFVKSSRRDIRQSLLGIDSGESGPVVYLRQQLSAIGDLRQQIAEDLARTQERLDVVTAERLVVAEVIKDGWGKLGSRECEEINNV